MVFSKKFLQVLILILLFLDIIFLVYSISEKQYHNLKGAMDKAVIAIDGHKIKVEIAKSPAELYHGLSDRSNLDQDAGMLFLFPDLKERQFVMRRMNFPLDIIFIKQGLIKKIDFSLKPEGKVVHNIYSSQGLVDSVLEINGGLSKDWGLKVGDKVIIDN